MRWVGVAAAVLAVVLMALPSAMATGTHPTTEASRPAAAHAPLLAPPPTGSQLLRGLLQHNLSIPSAGPTPVSAYQETPPPPVPNTMPTVVRVVTNGQGCCYYVNQTPAGGPWDSVVLNYTGTVVGGVYDSSYRAYIGAAEVLYGTTPEYGTWTVLQNVTEYESLLEPGANFTFLLSAAVVSGYFETSLTLSFYPPPGGAPTPREPSQVISLWTKYVQASLPVVSATGTVPSDASAVSLELWAYGMGPNNGDEFWWASTTPERAVELSLDGNPLAAVYPFPYLNTGGIDLFLWRPIPAAYTLSDRPYSVNLTGALGELDGTHTYNVTIGGRHAPDPWWTAASLLVWTDPSVTRATLTGSAATWPSPNTVGGTVTSTTSFHYQSTLTTAAGPVNVSTTGSGSFRETQTQFNGGTNGSSWSNFTQTSALATQTTVVGPNGTAFANATRAFTFGTDLGTGPFVESSSTGGGYPIFGNVSSYMLQFQQAWTEIATITSFAIAGGRSSTSDALDNEVTGANGIFNSEDKLTSATASPTFLQFGFVQAATPKYTAERTTGPAGSSAYSHIMSGSDYQPTDPNLSETVLENRYDSVPLPLTATVRATPNPLDVGQSVTILASVTGGAGVYSYAWTNLPSGCAASSSAIIACAPTAAGTFLPSVAVVDSSGNSIVTAPSVLVVAPALNATVGTSTPGSDVGRPLSFSTAITGGTPPFACSWTIAGVAATDPCNASVPADTSVPGSIIASVSVTDAAGAVANASSGSVVVHTPLLLAWDPANGTATVGVAANYSLAVDGGTAPFVLTWFEGSSALSGLNGTSETLVPTTAGNLTISVRATDAAGASASSPPLSVVVHAARSNGTGPSPHGGSTGSDTTFWLAVGLGALAGVEAIFLIARRIPPRPPAAH
ncbi:MAG: hypothetical protein L3K18_05470 [Thermoplasmata archaeon]|nr:hypothetical protein [Thermoplasmata archaeon]